MAMKIDDILNALPSREELAQYLHTQYRSGTSSSTGTSEMAAAFGIFGAGLLLGAGLALLFAPKAGTELRQELANKVGEMNDRYGVNSHSEQH